MNFEIHGELDTITILDTFVNSTDELLVMVDKDGYVVVLTKAYADFLRVDRNRVLGKHVTEVIENTRMHIVIKTGVPEIAKKQIVRGENMIASRFPIVKNGEIVGGYGRVLFKNINDLNKLYEQINNIEKELTLYKKALTDQHRPRYHIDDIITANPEMMRQKGMICNVAKTRSNVLLLGESGTGKELFAHAIHSASGRAQRPFVSINCGAIPSELLESELFGYEAGAFTGASKRGKIGIFQVADRGTILLDEIGEMSVQLQVKLLRFLQERTILKVGSTVHEKVDVRIIAATNANLPNLIKEGRFRADLYYRLSVVLINIPPLRERREDIKLLVNHLIAKICRREHITNARISKDALRRLMHYDWPGNVRELENVIESALNFVGTDNVIRSDGLPARIAQLGARQKERFDVPDLKNAVDAYEKGIILRAIDYSGTNKSKTAELLGISRTSLYEKMRRYELE